MKIILLISALFSLSTTSFQINSEEISLPSISVNSPSVQAGSSGAFTIDGNDFLNVGALELSVFYPSNYVSVYSHYLGALTPSGTNNINYSTQGVTKFSFVSSTQNGVNGSGQLFTIYFSLANDTPIEDICVDIAIGEVYDVSLNPININSIHAYIDVVPAPTYISRIDISATKDKTSYLEAEEALITLNTSYTYGLSALKLTITFDYSSFSFESFLFTPNWNTSNDLYSINANSPGTIVITYASLSGKYLSGTLANLKLRALIDENTISNVGMTLSDCYDANLAPLNGSAYELEIKTISSLPRMYFEDIALDNPDEFSMTLNLDGRSLLAAVDVIISYDKSKIVATEVTPAGLPGQFIMINPTFNNGQVRFSFIDMDGIDSNQSLISIKFIPTDYFTFIDTNLSLSTVSPVDKNSNPVLLSLVNPSILIEFTLTSIEIQASWLEGLPSDKFTIHSETPSLYVNTNNSFSIYINEQLFDGEISFNLADFSNASGRLAALKNGVYLISFSNSVATITSTTNEADIEKAYNDRAFQYTNLLRLHTDGVTICNTSGILDNKLDTINYLVTEYQNFPSDLRNIIDTMPSSDNGSSVFETMQVLARALEKANINPSGLLKYSESKTYLSFFIVSSLIGCTLLVFFTTRKETIN